MPVQLLAVIEKLLYTPADRPANTNALLLTVTGAGLDVFATEPAPPNKLFDLPNVILAPHMAGVTQEALDRMAVACVRNILSAIDGKPEAENVVNKDVLK